MQVQNINNQSFGMRYINVDDSVQNLGKNVTRALENSITGIKDRIGGNDTDLFVRVGGFESKKLVFEVRRILSVPKSNLFGKTKIVDRVYASAMSELDAKDANDLFSNEPYEATLKAVNKLEDSIDAKKSMLNIKHLCAKLNDEVK